MGWLYTQKAKGISVRDFFQGQFGDKVEILECKVKNLHTAYMAVKVKDTGEVFGLVCLLNYNPNDVCNFGYKDIDEGSGPYECECPESILKLLTPTDSKYALKWRKDCWDNIKERKAKPALKVGDRVVFEDRLAFAGEQIQEFDVYLPRRNLFTNHGRCYRICGWRKMKYKVEGKVTV